MLHVWHAKATYVNFTHSVAMMMVIKWDSDLQNLQTVKLKRDLISRFKHTKQTKNCQNIGNIIKNKIHHYFTLFTKDHMWNKVFPYYKTMSLLIFRSLTVLLQQNTNFQVYTSKSHIIFHSP